MTRRISSPRLVEREQQLESLEKALDSACQGAPGIELILGEAGIGKTRLVAEVEQRAKQRGMLVLRGTCVELESGELPYAPIAGSLREIPLPLLEKATAGISAAGRVELARAFPQVLPGLNPDSPAPHDEYSQARLFEFLLALIRGLGRESPLLLILEDFHWADRSTRDALAFLVRNVRSEPLVTLISSRNDELPKRHPARRMLGELARHDRAQCVELEGLSRGGVRDLVEEIQGTSPSWSLVDSILVQSGGNPFFVEELLASRFAGSDETLPELLSDLVLIRFHGLSPGARRVVQCLAVIGRTTVDAGLLHAAAGVEEPALSSQLREAVEAHVLAFAPGEAGFGFRHQIVRSAVQQELLPGERVELHGNVASALTQSATECSNAELAIHWRAAGQVERAFVASVRAGLDAEHAHAASEAFGHFEQALSLRGQLPVTPEEAGLAEVELLIHAASAVRSCGNHERAAELCDEALDRVDAEADPRGAARMLELRGLCESWSAPAAALESLREAERILPAECIADRTRVLGAEGFALANRFLWEEARDRCESALRLAQEGDDEGEATFAHMVLGLALGFLGDPVAGEVHLVHAREVSAALDRHEDLMRAHLYLGEVLRLQGRFADSATLMREGETTARSVGLEGSFGRYMLVNAADDLFHLGRWGEAAQLIDATGHMELAPWSLLMRHIVAGRLAVAMGAFGAAGDHLRRADALCHARDGEADFAAPLLAARAELALWRGQAEEARGFVATATALVTEQTDHLNAPVLFWIGARAASDAAEGSRALGDERREAHAIDEAGHTLAALDALLARAATAHVPPMARCYRASCAAEASRARGEHAPELWRAAAEGWERCGMPYPAAYSRWRAAEAALAAVGERHAATADLRRAQTTAAELKAEPLLRQTAALATRARLDLGLAVPEPVGETPPEGAYGLTPRELEVLALIGKGLTNRQIGEHLFISQKTAGVHVSHIFAKLDVHTRVSAAGAAYQLGLIDGPAAGPLAVRS